MLTKTNRIKCDTCGKFIPYKDIVLGKAYNVLVYPGSDMTEETHSSECRKCYKPEEGKENNSGGFKNVRAIIKPNFKTMYLQTEQKAMMGK